MLRPLLAAALTLAAALEDFGGNAGDGIERFAEGVAVAVVEANVVGGSGIHIQANGQPHRVGHGFGFCFLDLAA